MDSEQKIHVNALLLYGGLNLSNPFTGSYFVNEIEGDDESLMAKLLFPHAYKLGKRDLEDDFVWERTYYPVDEVIKTLRTEGISLLQKKYECNDVEFLRQLRRWLNFIEFMREQERNLNEPCRIIVHVATW